MPAKAGMQPVLRGCTQNNRAFPGTEIMRSLLHQGRPARLLRPAIRLLVCSL